MTSRRLVGTATLLALGLAMLTSCRLDPYAGNENVIPQGNSVHLNDALIDVITARTALIAQGRPELAWLGDTLSRALREGRSLEVANIHSDFTTEPFYGMGVHRRSASDSSSRVMFDVVFLTNPTDPRDFIILHADSVGPKFDWIDEAGGTWAKGAPANVRATIFHLREGVLSTWRTARGKVTLLLNGASGVGCRLFDLAPRLECHNGWGHATFEIRTVSEGGSSPGSLGPAALGSVEFYAVNFDYHNKKP